MRSLNQGGELLLPPLNLGPQVVLGVALRDVLRQGTVVGQEVGRDVDGLGVPHLAVLQAVLARIENSQKPQFGPDAEVRHNHVQGLVQHAVLRDLLGHKVAAAVLPRLHARNRLALLRAQVVEAKCLQVHDVADVETKNPIVNAHSLETQTGASRNFKLFLILETVNLLMCLE